MAAEDQTSGLAALFQKALMQNPEMVPGVTDWRDPVTRGVMEALPITAFSPEVDAIMQMMDYAPTYWSNMPQPMYGDGPYPYGHPDAAVRNPGSTLSITPYGWVPNLPG